MPKSPWLLRGRSFCTSFVTFGAFVCRLTEGTMRNEAYDPGLSSGEKSTGAKISTTSASPVGYRETISTCAGTSVAAGS
jgi:hypothetical protein